MIRTIDQLDFEIDQRVTGDGAMSRGFDDSFFNCRPELLRDRSAKNFVFKFETSAAR
jgi:hypothetical protein